MLKLNGRELFLDDRIINTELTTATRLAHKPTPRELVLELNNPWEGDLCGYPSIIADDGVIRLYYRGYKTGSKEWTVCYAESNDGIHFEKPDLGIYKRFGSGRNNIILTEGMIEDINRIDNIYFFKDTNPDCPPSERYKAVLGWEGHGWLISLYSEDAINWRRGADITNKGAFDSQNIVFYDNEKKKYVCYCRGESANTSGVPMIDKSLPDAVGLKFYDKERIALDYPEEHEKYYMRSVIRLESEDFKEWSDPVEISFPQDEPRFQLYTNGIKPYPGVEGLYVGIATRYVERKEWNEAFDELCDRENRLVRIKTQAPRSGLAITDSILIATRDGVNFITSGESFVDGGVERDGGWVYGDCFFAPGFIETQSEYPSADNEYSVYCLEDYRSFKHTSLRRYRMRRDGFVSLHAPSKARAVVTKDFILDGNRLLANLSTSARGYVKFKLVSEGEEYESCEYFGNSVNKSIVFHGIDISKLSGKVCRLEIELFEADLYAIEFTK